MPKERHYALYHGDTYMTQGTVDDLAAFENVSRHTIYVYATPDYQKRGTKCVVPLYDNKGLDGVAVARIRNLITLSGMTQKEVAQAIGIKPYTMRERLKQYTRFKESELEALSELFGVSFDSLFQHESVDSEKSTL